MSSVSLISAEKISKSYSEKILFQELSLGIQQGEKIGLIGVNGTGKSTLLKVIAGVETPDTGRIMMANGIRIGYLPQNPYFVRGTTALQQALSKLDGSEAEVMEYEAKTVLSRLGISDFSADVSTLSGGQRKRVAIAAALLDPAELLILDEPTNHIDNNTVAWLEKYLNSRKGALLMVTHDRYFLQRVANRIIELDNGKLYSYQANYEKYLEMKAEREELEQAADRKRQNLLRTELEWIRRGAKARSTKQKARIDRFEKLSQEQGPAAQEAIEIKVGASRLGRKTIELDHVGKRFPGKELLRDFSYILLRDDRIGIIGPNGSGKSTLLKMIAGILEPDTGKIDRGDTVKIGFFSQESEEMNPNLRVIEYIREAAEYLDTGEGMISASQMLERFLFPPAVQWTPISKLSGGEKRRLYLLRVLMGAPNILLLDEPTNDLDIRTLTILESYLDEFPGAVITVSHDRYFLDRVVDKIFLLEGDARVRQFEGNYSFYLESIQTVGSQEISESPRGADSGSENAENKKNRPMKFTFKEQKEFEQIDERIASLEQQLEEVIKGIGEAASDFVLLQELLSRKEQLEKELEEAMERWVYLTELAEAISRNKTAQ